MYRIDIANKKFGRLVPIKYIPCVHTKNSWTKSKWECVCDCGNKITVRTCDIISGNTKSCGCIRKEIMFKKQFKDITGQRFGKVIVIKPVGYTSDHKITWLCKCDCGNEKVIPGRNLRKGLTSSCGCLSCRATLEDNIISNNNKNSTSLNQQKRYSSELVKWRMEVYERDKYKCQSCGQVGGGLEAHHILSWAQYPETRLDVDNGITLCRECHLHKVHGYKKKKVS